MFLKLFSWFVALHLVSGQLNGEFWWLNEKLAKLRNVEPSPPRFDGTNEFETDESVKVTFQSNEDNDVEESESLIKDMLLNKGEVWPSSITFRDVTELSKPTYFRDDIIINDKMPNGKQISQSKYHISKINSSFIDSNKWQDTDGGDMLEFVFPTNIGFNFDNRNVNNKPNETTTFSPPISDSSSNTFSTKIPINDKIWFENDNDNNFEEIESICTFLKKNDCIQKNGVVHMVQNLGYQKLHRSLAFENQKVCCILPLLTKFSPKLIFPDDVQDNTNRLKRSVTIDDTSAALKQRSALLQRKFVTTPLVNPTVSATQTKKPQKIISQDDYVDPYWNVKNFKFRKPSDTTNAYHNTKYDYSSQDYGDYTVELPKPGLIGLYSDLSSSQTTWKLSNKNKGFSYGGTDDVSEEEDENTSFGYNTFDPRRGSRVSTTKPKSLRRKPIKLTSSTEDMNHHTSHTITYHSKPDFHVLEGFKLLNLEGNRNRVVRKTATENHKDSSYVNTNREPCAQMMSTDYDNEDLVDIEEQTYEECGHNNQYADKSEEVPDPWLALVIETKSRQKILCYATIVHPRVAVTAADCVHGSHPGEVSLIAGVSELSENQSNSQQRLCTVHSNTQFKFGKLENNIALLHWKRPLKLDANIQPACLGDPHVGDDCHFVGWGGYDQALEKVSRRQRASILTPRACAERISKPDVDLPLDAFCAAVAERGTVTGIGGPLLCRTGERTSVVGVAVWREDVVVLLPTFQWVSMASRDLLQTS